MEELREIIIVISIFFIVFQFVQTLVIVENIAALEKRIKHFNEMLIRKCQK